MGWLSKLIDLTGQKFYEWTVIKKADPSPSGRTRWLCRCSCGKIGIVGAYDLKNGKHRSCGHDRKHNIKNLANQAFGELTAIEYAGNGKWKCKCSCGKEVIVSGYDLTSGHTKSCGHNTNNFIDLTGQTFGEWTVLEYVGNHLWKCKCSCGKISNVKTFNLTEAKRTGKDYKCAQCSYKDKLDDLTGKTFGKLKVIKYAGEQKYLCQCECGKTKIIAGKSLKNGSTRSCGCSVGQFLIESRLDKYGEICTTKELGARTEQQIILSSSKQDLEDYLVRLDHTPDVHELAQLLGVSENMVLRKIHKFELEELVKISPLVSKPETELYEYIKTLTTHEVIQSDRSILHGKELDIYIPDLKLAIEFNGVYWHSEVHKDEMYHQQKTLDCLKQGVRLIHIFEYEWINPDKQDKIKIYLADVISEHSNIYYARNLNIREPSTQESAEFLDKYHLQGYTNAPIRYGLYNNTEMLGIITFGKPRFSSNYEYELIRLCWKPGVNVVGGFERLFKHFVTEHNPSSIVTYSDISKFTGNSYLRVGFKASIDDLTSPNYVWVSLKDYSTLSRYQTQKHKLVELGLGDVGDTEASIMENLGYIRMYDCGNLRLSWYKQ